MPDEVLTAMYLTLKLAFITSFLLLFISIPLAYIIAFSKGRWVSFLEAVVSLPLVLPPTVLGFYLLLLMSKKGPIGAVFYQLTGHQLVFHFEGLVLASVIYSLPMMVHPIASGFASVPKRLIEASYSLGKNPLQTLFLVILPNSKGSILSGIILSFTHTLGEFGVVLMVGGNIEGETRVMSVLIYDSVEALDYKTAHILSLIMLSFSFFSLFMLYYVLRHKPKVLS
ncbi:molybdate ABC transporter, inner membrane subunit [Thermocrinis albus DSM 14484]|uniref:Molybdenum transport system permease n=1 Tax=Thermocrinis albus (strain DSM 14484 / JCM 11386 / HI 11/12) TaxID=638303 RepID=D3SNC1_THEAH|nr:molybdate ABC transporter permease subunit [Thermocrinis albus]ADC88658.1 molybdate ABC transporter, inner membrane subunit [Thermocrinis albus DSM 14484]